MPAKPYDTVKRGMDIVGAAVLLVATAPIQAGVAVAVAQKLGRPVLFRQQRPGKDGKPFTLLKFRTMLPVDEESGLVSNEQRMTPFGRTLRSTSLDELPSLWNVLRGELSLVGPRPLLMSYLPLYSHEQFRRHEVRPGLTGLAQVNGRNSLDWESRFVLDVRYVDHRSTGLDLRILWQTLLKVLSREGVASEGHVVGAPFSGGARQRSAGNE